MLPIGTTWRLDPDAGSAQRILYLEAPSEIEPPKRYRNDYGQLLEHAPYSQRDLHAPDEVAPRDDEGDFVIHVRSADRITAYHYRHHPFDLVGWDGYLWPFRFNIGDFQPITGRVHQPPPVHQTFQARNFVVCSFVPRKFDYHPLAIPAPYNHSNINSDEVIYYVAGNFMSRRGVEIASFTLHPAGIPHGPHPGTVEASIGKEATEELAVMVDTFHPLHDHAGGDGPRRRALPVQLAARRGPRRGSLRARGARPGGVPGLTSVRALHADRCAPEPDQRRASVDEWGGPRRARPRSSLGHASAACSRPSRLCAHPGRARCPAIAPVDAWATQPPSAGFPATDRPRATSRRPVPPGPTIPARSGLPGLPGDQCLEPPHRRPGTSPRTPRR